MNPEEHPEYPLEKQILRDTALLIEQDIETHRSGYMEGGGNLWTNRSINRNIREDALKSLEDNQYKPYFARLEFLDSSGKNQNYYFGMTHIQLPHITVLSWQSPVYSLFIQGTPQRQSYSYQVPARNKTHHVQLLLKRRFEVSLHDIHFMKDEVDYRKNAPRAPTHQDSFLVRKLQQRGAAGLQDIVETIQIDQDRIIRAPLNVSLVLHGVAGSGKTSVAFHRLAYLLFDETGHNLTPEDVLVLAPTRRFLHHVRDLLPTLGVKGVQQVTFFDWVFQQFKNDRGVDFEPEDYSLEDSHFEGFLEAQTIPNQHPLWQASTVKNSLKFLELIERYTQSLYAGVQLPEDDVVFEEQLGVQKVQVAFKPSQVRKALSSAFEAHSGYSERRQQFLQNLQSQFLEMHEQRFWSPQDNEDRRYIQAMSARINIHFGRLYRRFNLMAFYRELFEPRTLMQLDRGLLEIWELSALQQEPARKSRKKSSGGTDDSTEETRLQLDMTDVAPLYALYLSLKGKAAPSYRHIIIDEAQDFTPLQLALLRQHNPEGSFTIVGDTAQNIFAHRGMDDWSGIKSVLGNSAISEKITQNYRSTKEIVLFGNAVQQVVRGSSALKAIPVARHGQKPVLHQSDQVELLLKAMLETLHHLAHQGKKNIAVLTRDRKQAQNLSTWLSEQKVLHNLQLDNNPALGTQQQDSILSVLPAAVSKGMEFEAVLVYDTSENNYPVLNPLLGKLLFVAVSRALHELYLFSLGRPSGHLRSTQGLCKHLHHPAPEAVLPDQKPPRTPSPASKPNPSFQKPKTHAVIRLKPHLTSYQGLQVTLQGSGHALPTDDLLHYQRVREVLQDLLGEDFIKEMDANLTMAPHNVNPDLVRLLQLGFTSLQTGKKPGTHRPQNVPEAVWQSWLHHFEEHRRQLLTPELRSLQFELYFNPARLSERGLHLLSVFKPAVQSIPISPPPATNRELHLTSLFRRPPLPQFSLSLRNQLARFPQKDFMEWRKAQTQLQMKKVLGEGLLAMINQALQKSTLDGSAMLIDVLYVDLMELGFRCLQHRTRPGGFKPTNVTEQEWTFWVRYRALVVGMEREQHLALFLMQEMYFNRQRLGDTALNLLRKNIQDVISHPDWKIFQTGEQLLLQVLQQHSHQGAGYKKVTPKLKALLQQNLQLHLVHALEAEVRKCMRTRSNTLSMQRVSEVTLALHKSYFAT